LSIEDKILKTSLKLFSKYGYSGVTTKKIATESGVNEVTIFRKFQSKSNLFQEVIANFSAEGNIINKLKKDLTGVIEKDLMIFAEDFYKFLLNNQLFYKLQIKQVDENSIKFTNSLKYKNYFRDYLIEKKEKGEFRGDPEMVAVSIISIVMGIFTFQIFNKEILEKLNIKDILEEQIKKIIVMHVD
jgi:AcrR family transcriptional regulator